MPSLVRILHRDRTDSGIINLALEALTEVICEEDQLGEQFAEILIKDRENVSVLLALLEVTYAYTYTYTGDTVSKREI